MFFDEIVMVKKMNGGEEISIIILGCDLLYIGLRFVLFRVAIWSLKIEGEDEADFFLILILYLINKLLWLMWRYVI